MESGSLLLLWSFSALSTAYSAVIVEAPSSPPPSGLNGGAALSSDFRPTQYWTSPRPYTNVSVSVEINNLGLSLMTFDWYLTNSVGTGTTAANEYAHGTFVLAAQTGGFHLLTSGLALPAGTFYLTIGASGCGGANTCAAWPFHTGLAGPVLVAPGVNVVSGSSLIGGIFPPYVPAANYSYFPGLSPQVMLVPATKFRSPHFRSPPELWLCWSPRAAARTCKTGPCGVGAMRFASLEQCPKRLTTT